MSVAILERRAIPVLVTNGENIKNDTLVLKERTVASLLRQQVDSSLQRRYLKNRTARKEGMPISGVQTLSEKLDLLGYSEQSKVIPVGGSPYTSTKVYKIIDNNGVSYVKEGEDVPNELSGVQLFLSSPLGKRAVPSIISIDQALWVMPDGGDIIVRQSLRQGLMPPGSSRKLAEIKVNGIFDFIKQQKDLEKPLEEPVGGIQPQEYLKLRKKAEETVVNAFTALGIFKEQAKETEIEIEVDDGNGNSHSEKLGSFNSLLKEMDNYMLDESGKIKSDFTYMGSVLGDLSTKNESVMLPDSDAVEDYEDMIVQSLTFHDIGGYTKKWGNLAEQFAIAIKSVDTLTHIPSESPVSLDLKYNAQQNSLAIENLQAKFSRTAIEYQHKGEEIVQKRAEEVGELLVEEVTICGAISRFGELAQGRVYTPQEIVYLLAMSGKYLNKAKELREKRLRSDKNYSLRRVMKVAHF